MCTHQVHFLWIHGRYSQSQQQSQPVNLGQLESQPESGIMILLERLQMKLMILIPILEVY